jgi:hypothetical protein
VLDEDPRHGGDLSLSALLHEHGSLPTTVTCQTGVAALTTTSAIQIASIQWATSAMAWT